MQPKSRRERRGSHREYIFDFSLRFSLRPLRLGGCISTSRKRSGFSLVELLVVIGILILLLSIFIPYFSSLVESSRRNRCQDNLRKIGFALSEYAQANRGAFPRVRCDSEKNPHGYTAFTGADAADPFAGDSATSVAANDVTASLWLLVRQNYLAGNEDGAPSSHAFICPSAGEFADAMLDAAGKPVAPTQRGNFRSAENLSYSYASPFSDATGYGMIDFYLNAQFVMLADQNPGIGKAGSDVTAPPHDAPPAELAKANSRNHNRAGQYVLFADMHVEFSATPYCGVGQDNIYTALAPEPIFTGVAPTLNAKGHFPAGAPAWQTDSFLVPAE